MNKIITQVIGLAVIAVVFTTSLAAQSVFMPNDRVDEQRMQLRADKKAWPEYIITYSPSGEMSYKSVFEYNAEGNRTTQEQYSWENNDWVISGKVVAEYDAEGNMTSDQGYSWVDNSWVNSFIAIYESDAERNMTLNEFYFWRNDSWVGNSKTVYEYTDGERSKTQTYRWTDGDWVLTRTVGTFDQKPSFLIDGDYILFGYPMLDGYVPYPYDGETMPDTRYSTNGNLMYFEFGGNTYYMKYNTFGKPVLVERKINYCPTTKQWRRDFIKAVYEYDDNGNCTLYESSEWIIGREWAPITKGVYEYNAQGERTLDERYKPNRDSSTWVLDSRQEWKYDSKGNLTHDYTEGGRLYIYKYDGNGNEVASYYYYSTDGNKVLYDYSISYPNNYKPEVYISNITEIGESNEGSFDITTSMSIDSIQSGSLRVTLPEGFILDEEKTAFASGLANKYDLNIHEQADGSFNLDIAFKRNASNSRAGNILRIAYKADEELVRGTYDIAISQVLFNTPGGNFLPAPATVVPAEVTRGEVSNELTDAASPKAYTAGNTLYIYVAQTEQVAVYSLTGHKFYETTVSAGTTAINTAAFPQGILIVKSSNGWAKKVIND